MTDPFEFEGPELPGENVFSLGHVPSHPLDESDEPSIEWCDASLESAFWERGCPAMCDACEFDD